MARFTPTPMPPSKRQLEVLALVASGYTHKEVCKALNIRPSTVRNHLRDLYDRLNVNSAVEAAALAAAHGLIHLTPREDY